MKLVHNRRMTLVVDTQGWRWHRYRPVFHHLASPILSRWRLGPVVLVWRRRP